MGAGQGAAAAAAGAGRGVAVAAADRGRGGAGRHRHTGGDVRAHHALGDGDKEIWLAGNTNKKVPEEKVVISASPFSPLKKDFSPVKVKNNKLRMIHNELRAIKNLSSKTMEIHPEAFARQKDLLDEAKRIEKELKDDNEMAIPMPKFLLKKPNLFK